ncbi:MAG: pectinesterase family protein [Bacteroides sp.]|nr:pectinesterase family protein [Prevotella sp.]MCM1407115.1 pectinesterase family protein [Treponema brennaborense]MCM1470267.1 pectinesterase family protein [Bacteroides sp.]
MYSVKNKKTAAVLLFVLLAAAAVFAAPQGWKLYVPGTYDARDAAADVRKAGFTIGPEFSNHFGFVDNTSNGKKCLKLDTRDGKADALMLPLAGGEKRVTILFKAKGSLIPDAGTTPFGILWACWQRENYQAVLRHNQTNQIKGSSGQTNLRPDDVVSDWHDFRLVFETADEEGRAMTASCYIDGKLRHQTKSYKKKTVDTKKIGYDPETISGNGNYVLFGENDGSTNGFGRYAYFLFIVNDDVSAMSLAEIGAKAGADLVTAPVTANDPNPQSLRPAAKPAGITMTKADGVPVDAAGNVPADDWIDPAAVSDGKIDLDKLPYSKNKAEKLVRTPKKPKIGKKALIVDAAGGAGSYTTVGDAVAAAPETGATIYIKPGVYRLQEKLLISKTGIKLVGEDPATTILYGYEADKSNIDGNLLVEVNLLEAADPEPGTEKKVVYAKKNASFSAENITFYNKGAEWNATWQSSERRSIALSLKGVTEGYIKNCVFLGQQDTLYLKSGRIYFENCYIEGEVDFICGGATVLFGNCHIYSIYYKNGGYITAAAPADSALASSDAELYANGYVFRSCLVNGDEGVSDMCYLGRGAWVGGSNAPENSQAKVVYIDCELGKNIIDAGWKDWDNVNTAEKCFFREYRSAGEGAIQAETKTRKFMTDEEYNARYASTQKILGFSPKLKY